MLELRAGTHIESCVESRVWVRPVGATLVEVPSAPVPLGTPPLSRSDESYCYVSLPCSAFVSRRCVDPCHRSDRMGDGTCVEVSFLCAGSFSQSVLIRLEAWNTGADGIDRAPRHGWRSCAARCSRRPARGAPGPAHCRAGSEKCPKSVPGPVWIQTWRLPVNRDLQRWCILSPTGP